MVKSLYHELIPMGSYSIQLNTKKAPIIGLIVPLSKFMYVISHILRHNIGFLSELILSDLFLK